MSERSPLLTRSDSTPSSQETSKAQPINANDLPTSFLRGLCIAFAIFVQIFILTFGVSVITTIQSPIAGELGVSSGASWFVSAYLIANTSVTPVAGKICEIFSPRSYLLASTLVQIIGLAITALSTSFATFVFGRAVCGVGAAAVTPVAFILVTELANQRRWGLLFGLINCGYTSGIALGAIIGGELEPRIGWRAVFWTQIPACLIASVIAYVAILPKPKSELNGVQTELTSLQKVARIDFFGVITLIGSVVLFLITLAAPSIDAVPMVLAVALLSLFFLVESKWAVEPIVPVSVICSRSMLFTGVATIGLMCARWEVLFYVPMYAIAVRGWAQSAAGVLLIPTNLGFGIGSLVVGAVHIKKAKSYYTACLVCFALFLLEHFGLSRLATPDSSIWLFAVALFGNGFLSGALLTYSLAHLLHLSRPSQHVIVIPLNAMFRSLSGSIGSSLAGGIFVRSLQHALQSGFRKYGLHGKDELIEQLLGRPLLVQQLQGIEKEVAVDGYASTIQHLFTVGCLWVILMMILQAFTGWTAPEEDTSRDKRRSSEDPASLVEGEPLLA